MAVCTGCAAPTPPLLVDVETPRAVVVVVAVQAEVTLATRLEMLLAMALSIWTAQGLPWFVSSGTGVAGMTVVICTGHSVSVVLELPWT